MALQLLALTATRSGEVRGMTWGEVSLPKALWTVPAPRTKTKREHRVPLSAPAVALLASLRPEEPKPGELAFKAPRLGPLSDMSLSTCMRRMTEGRVKETGTGWCDPASGRPAVPHGLRSAFRSWSAERTDVPREIAELCLGHCVGSGVEQAYQRSDLLERRRALMAMWSEFVVGGR